MSIIRKHIEIFLVVFILIVFGLVPAGIFISNFLEFYKNDNSVELLSNIEMWYYMLHIADGVQMIIMVSPVLIMILSTYDFHRKLNSGFLLQEIQRINYKTIMIKNILVTWIKSSLFFLSYSFLLFLITFSVPTNNDWVSSTILRMESPTKLFIILNINIVFYSLFVTNIGLIVISRIKKFILSAVMTQISFIIITMILYVIGLLLSSLLKNDLIVNTLYVINVISLDSVVSYEITTIIILFLFVISGIGVFFTYKSKEVVVMNIAEKI